MVDIPIEERNIKLKNLFLNINEKLLEKDSLEVLEGLKSKDNKLAVDTFFKFIKSGNLKRPVVFILDEHNEIYKASQTDPYFRKFVRLASSVFGTVKLLLKFTPSGDIIL